MKRIAILATCLAACASVKPLSAREPAPVRELHHLVVGRLPHLRLREVVLGANIDTIIRGGAPTSAGMLPCSTGNGVGTWETAAACGLASTGQSSFLMTSSGTSSSSPGQLGWSPLATNAEMRLVFGDSGGGAIQGGWGSRLQIINFNGIAIYGQRNTSSALAYETGSGTSDYSLEVHDGSSGLGLKVDGLTNINGNISVSGTASTITHETYHTPSFGTGWANSSGTWQTARYYKDPFGRIHIEGIVNGTSVSSGSTIFTLTTGYIPSAYHNCTTSGYNGTSNVLVVLEIRSTGAVVYNPTTSPGGSTNLSLYCDFDP